MTSSLIPSRSSLRSAAGRRAGTPARVLGSVVMTAALATSLTACGSSAADDFAGQSVKKIEAQTKQDMKAVKSLTMSGQLEQNGKTTSIDLTADTAGNCTGTLGQSGGKAHVLSVDGDSYLKADKSFWQAQAGDTADQIVAMLGDKWAKLPSGAGGFDQFCDLDNFLEDINAADNGSKVSKGGLEDVAGQKALKLTSKGKDGTTLGWVAAEGKHYFLKMQKKGSEAGTFEFSDFNKPVKAKAPATADVFDLSSMG